LGGVALGLFCFGYGIYGLTIGLSAGVKAIFTYLTPIAGDVDEPVGEIARQANEIPHHCSFSEAADNFHAYQQLAPMIDQFNHSVHPFLEHATNFLI
jgi:hypothetical protein